MGPSELKIAESDALIVIDPQIDFCPGGALAVVGGDEIMPGIAELAPRFPLVVITQDWHPPEHRSFASSHQRAEPFGSVEMPYGPQVLWPDHCVQGSVGAGFHPALGSAVERAHLILRKGYNPGIDSYSAFYENDKKTATGLSGYLRDKNVRRCIFVGLAYDFCVAWSALDARREGFEAVVLKSFTKAIGMAAEHGRTTIEIAEHDFREAGVQLIDAKH